MRKSRTFCPDAVAPLEERVVAASHLHAALHVASVVPAVPVVTTRSLNQVVQGAYNSFSSFLNDYQKVIRTIRVDATGNPSDADLNRFYHFLDVRTQKFSNQLTALSGKVPYGRVNLAPAFQDRVAGLADTLASVSTVQEARHPGPATLDAFRGVKSDLQAYVSDSVQSGLFRVR